MKSVLISIQPKWCNLIAQKKKTVEVRKTKPILQAPFKCYIYCTKDPVLKLWTGPRYSYTDDHSHNSFDRNGNGKVIGEFVCDVVIDGKMHAQDWVYICENCEVPGKELYAYCGENESGDPNYCFGWNITDLVIYDRPKELSEFTALRKTKFGYEPIPLKRPPQSWCYVETLE